MTNLLWIPAQDDFETTLSASWNGWTGSMLVFNIPEWTLPTWEHTFVVVEPWTSNMQVAEISGWTESPKALTVSNVGIEKAHGEMYTAKMHPANSIVRISNNFAFWKEIKEAVNSKADPSIVGDYSFSNNEISVTGDVAQFTPSGADITISTSWDMKFKDKNVWPVSLSQIIRPAQWWSAIEVMSETDFQQLDSPDVNTWYFRHDTDNVITKMYFNGCDCNFWWKADIHNQTEKCCIEANDEFVIADSSDCYENKKVKPSDIYKWAWANVWFILIAWWWGGWKAMQRYSWWWGGWWNVIQWNITLLKSTYDVTIWEWWAWSNTLCVRWCDWGKSCFNMFIVEWWWGGWSGWGSLDCPWRPWKDWGNWWWWTQCSGGAGWCWKNYNPLITHWWNDWETWQKCTAYNVCCCRGWWMWWWSWGWNCWICFNVCWLSWCYFWTGWWWGTRNTTTWGWNGWCFGCEWNCNWSNATMYWWWWGGGWALSWNCPGAIWWDGCWWALIIYYPTSCWYVVDWAQCCYTCDWTCVNIIDTTWTFTIK